MSQSLVRPCVVQRRGQVKLAVENDEQRPVEAELASLNAIADKQGVAGVSQVLSDLLVQLLRHSLRSIALGTADNGDGSKGNTHGKQAVYNLWGNNFFSTFFSKTVTYKTQTWFSMVSISVSVTPGLFKA